MLVLDSPKSWLASGERIDPVDHKSHAHNVVILQDIYFLNQWHFVFSSFYFWLVWLHCNTKLWIIMSSATTSASASAVMCVVVDFQCKIIYMLICLSTRLINFKTLWWTQTPSCCNARWRTESSSVSNTCSRICFRAVARVVASCRVSILLEVLLYHCTTVLL